MSGPPALNAHYILEIRQGLPGRAGRPIRQPDPRSPVSGPDRTGPIAPTEVLDVAEPIARAH